MPEPSTPPPTTEPAGPQNEAEGITEGENEPEGENSPGNLPEVNEGDPETFDRAYVERLRRESAGYRERAQRADDLSERLLAATVREATAGILADPTDLPTSDDLLDDDGFPDPDAIRASAEALVERKPHLGDRRPAGTVDQGARAEETTVDLAGIVRGLAG